MKGKHTKSHGFSIDYYDTTVFFISNLQSINIVTATETKIIDSFSRALEDVQ